MTAFLWTMLWQTALLALAAASLGTLLRRQPAAARHWLYFGALILAAVLPAASAWLHFDVPLAASSGSVTVLTQAAPAGAAALSGDPAGGAPAHYPALGLWLGSLWGAAMLLQAASLARRWWRARLAWRQAAPERMVADVPVLRGAQGPFTLGWLRPRIVLPELLLASDRWTSAALAHELAHVRRRDYLWAWLGELALLPLAWHPGARWLARQAGLEREAACDEAALAAGPDYPARLVEMAAALHAGSTPGAALCLARRQGFERRIAWLLAAPASRSRVRLLVGALGLSLAAAGGWALGGGVRVVASRQQQPRAVNVGAPVQAAMCISCQSPTYPPAAKAAGVQGKVEMHAVIGADGAVATVNCGMGDPDLLAAAEDAVRQWRYHPLELNGTPQSVSTTIVVNFALDSAPAVPPIQGLRGQVCDQQGDRMAGASIEATALATGTTAQTNAASDGSFALDLPDGVYKVTVSQRGFKPLAQRVTLPLRNELLLLVSLGESSQNVLVNGGHPGE